MGQENQDYWEKRKKLGRPKFLSSPTVLWRLACEYFQWVDSHPIKIQEQKRGSTTIKIDKGAHIPLKQMREITKPVIELETARPYLWEGLEAFLFEKHILVHLEDYRFNKDGRYSDYAGVIRAIGKIIEDRNISGASADVFNHNIIARYHGMVDKSSLKVAEEQPLFGPENETGEDDQ